MIVQVMDYVVDELFYEMGEFLVSYLQLYIVINFFVLDFYLVWLILQISEKVYSYVVCIG